jgi:hypothetical protein
MNATSTLLKLSRWGVQADATVDSAWYGSARHHDGGPAPASPFHGHAVLTFMKARMAEVCLHSPVPAHLASGSTADGHHWN